MDFSPFLLPVSESSPCGPYLEDDNEWGDKIYQLEQKLEGQKRKKEEEGQVLYEIIPPKWTEIRSGAFELCHASRTLRLGTILTECAFELEGLPGFRDGIRMIGQWLDQWWDTLHPTPEEESDDARETILSGLDAERFVLRLRKMPVVSHFGQNYSIQDILQGEDASGDENLKLLARGAISGSLIESSPMGKSARDAALEAQRARLSEWRRAADETAELLDKISAIFAEKSRARRPLPMGQLMSALRDFQRLLNFSTEEQNKNEEKLDINPSSAKNIQETEIMVSDFHSGNTLNSKAAVKTGLESMIRFYEKNEPSSPVPLLLKRALRCMGLTFIELLDEVALTKDEAVKLLRSPSENTTE